MTFQDLNLINPLQQAITDQGYTTPTPIQQQAIPEILLENDVVGCAQTGTGKTAAFAIPIIQLIQPIVGSMKKTKRIRTLIITPTRELAVQINDNFNKYAMYTNVRSYVLYGGVNQEPQVDQLKAGVDVLITTPGRLLDLYKQGFINLDNVFQLVLDEADQMFDMGFINDVKKIIKLTPTNRQTMLFSATMPMAVRELADAFLKNPKYITIAPTASTENKIVQKVYFVNKSDKRSLLYHILRNDKLDNVLVFARTKNGADSIVKSLEKHGVLALAIHGDKTQNTRQAALDSFKNQEVSILVATDVAARGIDIDNLSYVINFDLPNNPETFLHRIGRTGRAGNSGVALSFCGKDELVYWQNIERNMRTKAKVIADHPYTWKDDSKDPNAKIDRRNTSSDGKKKSNSRKSENSKKNKKRWY